jgi:hypothetical protein
MKIYYYSFILLISSCSSNIKSIESLNEPNIYNQFPINKFSYSKSKEETISYVIEKLSNSPFFFEKPKDNFDFLIINYTTSEPELFVDCGETVITNIDDGDAINKQTLINAKSAYIYKKNRINHLDTYDIHNKLSMNANIITSGDSNNSNIVIQAGFNLKTTKLFSTTQGIAHRKLTKYKLQLASREKKLFNAFGIHCTSTGRFEKMIEATFLKK